MNRSSVGCDDARIARPRRRRRRQLDERLQKRLEAEVGQRAAEEDGRLNAGEILLDVEVGARRADDVERLAEMRVHAVADDGPRLGIVDRRDIDGRAILPLGFALVEMQRLPLDVVHAAELVGIAHRPVHRRRRDAQRRLDVVHQRERILGGPVELVDERQNRQPMAPAHLVELSRLRLDAVRRVDHHHDAVGGNQRAVRVFAEVLVAGRVEQRHAPPLNLELERRRRNRDAALLLELHPVGRRRLAILAAANRARQLDRAGIQQQLLGQRRLARVGMRDDGERPPPRDLALELAQRRADRFSVEGQRS